MADLWARVPRARVPRREVDKSTVNKPASMKLLFTTALSTMPMSAIQLWSNPSTEKHTHFVAIMWRTPKKPTPPYPIPLITICPGKKKKTLSNMMDSAFLSVGCFFPLTYNGVRFSARCIMHTVTYTHRHAHTHGYHVWEETVVPKPQRSSTLDSRID